MIVTIFLALLISEASAWHQEEYRVISERADLASYNRKYFSNVTFGLPLYNRTTRAFHFRGRLLVDVPDMRIVNQYYKFLSNEYRLFPVTIRSNLCKIFEVGEFGMDDIKKCSNIVGCPFKQGWYYVKNYVLDYTKFPPHAPSGRYKCEIKFYYDTEVVLELHWYAKFEDIIKWR